MKLRSTSPYSLPNERSVGASSIRMVRNLRSLKIIKASEKPTPFIQQYQQNHQSLSRTELAARAWA
jgi:hypothetical protein